MTKTLAAAGAQWPFYSAALVGYAQRHARDGVRSCLPFLEIAERAESKNRNRRLHSLRSGWCLEVGQRSSSSSRIRLATNPCVRPAASV
jgi:hypothetical protein